MKKIKKLIAVILCGATVLAVCVPLASAEEIPEEITASQQASQADSEGQDVDLPEEVYDANLTEEMPEQNEETVEEEETDSETEEVTFESEYVEETAEESSYSERIDHCVESGLKNLSAGGMLIGAFLLSPGFMAIPPIGLVIMVAGLPTGLGLAAVGAGEIIASPVLALFVDTNTSLTLF